MSIYISTINNNIVECIFINKYNLTKIYYVPMYILYYSRTAEVLNLFLNNRQI